MFYRICNHIFNLNEVIDIRITREGDIIVDLKNNNRYIICSGTVDVNALMDKIQKDLEMKG